MVLILPIFMSCGLGFLSLAVTGDQNFLVLEWYTADGHLQGRLSCQCCGRGREGKDICLYNKLSIL